MSASYKEEPYPENDELEELFKTFDKQLHEVQKKFSDLEKEIAALRKNNASDEPDDHPADNAAKEQKPDEPPNVS